MSKETKEDILQVVCYAIAGIIGWYLGKIYLVGLSLMIAAGIGLSFIIATWWD